MRVDQCQLKGIEYTTREGGNDALSTKWMTIFDVCVVSCWYDGSKRDMYGTNLGWIVGVFLWYGHAAAGVEDVALSSDGKYVTGILYNGQEYLLIERRISHIV